MQKLVVVSSILGVGLLGLVVGCKSSGDAAPVAASSAPVSAPAPVAAAPASVASPVADAPEPEVANRRPVIVCFGDSITAGLGVDPAVNYPADLQGDLDQAGYNYRVVNMGISGETTKDGLARVRGVLALKPEWVLVEFGGNDGLRGLRLRRRRRT